MIQHHGGRGWLDYNHQWAVSEATGISWNQFLTVGCALSLPAIGHAVWVYHVRLPVCALQFVQQRPGQDPSSPSITVLVVFTRAVFMACGDTQNRARD